MTDPASLLPAFWHAIHHHDLSAAAQVVQRLINNFPTQPDSWLAASIFAEHTAQPGQALQAIERALQLAPTGWSLQLRHLHCLQRTGQMMQAHAVADRLCHRPPQDAESLSELALQCSQLQRFDDAAQLYQQALRLDPTQATLYYNFATMRRMTGHIAQAEQLLDQAIQLDPTDTDAWHLRSNLRRQTGQHNHTAELAKALQHKDLSPKQRVQLHYALAKELEDLAQYPQSFAQLHSGATLRRQHIRYQLSDDLAVMRQISEQFNEAFFRQHRHAHSGYANTEAVFIISMPRAGSTLAERFLGCDPNVQLAGELTNFAAQLTKLCQQQAGKKLDKTALVKAAHQLDFATLGQAYLQSTRPLTGHKAHFVDKLPLNFLYAGLIHLALPQAKIIHISRNPIDHCYAIYKHLFADAYPFSYQLDEVAQYYQAYQQLMQHWEKCMPGVIHHLSYEDLISQPEVSSRALYQHCGLDWTEQCMEFHQQNKQASATGSASQIRQPLYSDSVARWRCYQHELAELVKAFPAAS